MLLAPFTLAETSRPARTRRRSAPVAPTQTARVPAWLLAWAILGTLAVLLVPALRGGNFGGSTLPFWLSVAPLLDIVWLTRRGWSGWLRRRFG